jgi:hypothetical protein
MRPTKSPTLYIQTCGRGLRPYKDKEDCLILDYASVVKTMGSLEDPIVLDPGLTKAQKKKEEEKKPKTCPECFSYVKRQERVCPDCEHEFWPESDATKNTTAKPDERASFFTADRMRFEVSKVILSNYKSKNGNNCIKIDYLPKVVTLSFHKTNVSEYFLIEHPWAMVKFYARAAELGIFSKEIISTQVCAPKPPKEVIYVMDGKYPKIEKLLFD